MDENFPAARLHGAVLDCSNGREVVLDCSCSVAGYRYRGSTPAGAGEGRVGAGDRGAV